MGARGPAPHRLKEPVLAALASGELRIGEAAWIAAVSRQRIEQWCAEAKIDAKAARKAHVKLLWDQEVKRQRMKARGVRPVKRSKAQLRAIGERAVTAWRR